MDDDQRSMGDGRHEEETSRSREKAEADLHLHQYVAEQLRRYKLQNGDYEHEDEFETTP